MTPILICAEAPVATPTTSAAASRPVRPVFVLLSMTNPPLQLEGASLDTQARDARCTVGSPLGRQAGGPNIELDHSSSGIAPDSGRKNKSRVRSCNGDRSIFSIFAQRLWGDQAP